LEHPASPEKPRPAFRKPQGRFSLPRPPDIGHHRAPPYSERPARAISQHTRLATILFVVNFLGGFVQITAFIAGIERWLGLPWFGAFLLFIPANTALIAASVVAYYGATQAWGWEWWQAALLCWPFLILGGVMLSVGLFRRG
jgi:hypothetical protein